MLDYTNMGNSCSATDTVKINTNGKCYVVNGQDSCNYYNSLNLKYQSFGSGLTCIVSAIAVFFVLDRKQTFTKILLGLSILCTLAAVVAYFINRMQADSVLKDKPSC